MNEYQVRYHCTFKYVTCVHSRKLQVRLSSILIFDLATHGEKLISLSPARNFTRLTSSLENIGDCTHTLIISIFELFLNVGAVKNYKVEHKSVIKLDKTHLWYLKIIP